MNRLYLYILLIFALIALSSAAAAFRALGDIPSPLKASWRLQITTIGQVIPYIYTWRTQPKECRTLIRQYFYLPILAGIFLSIHFSCWTLSLELTSMAHSLLLICTSPLIIVVGSILLCKKVKKSDIIGVSIGMAGILLISFDYQEGTATVRGDSFALIASFNCCSYFLVGNKALKELNLPLWAYIFPVNLTASLLCLIYSVIFYGDGAYFGWMNKDQAGYVIYLGLAPGLLGHASFNFLLKFMRPVIVTGFVNFEPVIGSFIGWVVGYQDIPGIFTWIGGAILLVGNMVVTIFDNQTSTQLKVSFDPQLPQDCMLIDKTSQKNSPITELEGSINTEV